MSEEPKTAYYDHLPGKFKDTQWTTIIRPSGKGDMAALDLLARTYWYPLFWHARRKGASHQDAEDQVQSFFAYRINSFNISLADP